MPDVLVSAADPAGEKCDSEQTLEEAELMEEAALSMTAVSSSRRSEVPILGLAQALRKRMVHSAQVAGKLAATGVMNLESQKKTVARILTKKERDQKCLTDSSGAGKKSVGADTNVDNGGDSSGYSGESHDGDSSNCDAACGSIEARPLPWLPANEDPFNNRASKTRVQCKQF